MIRSRISRRSPSWSTPPMSSWCAPIPASIRSPIWWRARKRRPTPSTIRAPGVGTKSHLSGEELKLRAGNPETHVPYRGAGPAALAVLEGTTQVGSVALAAAASLVKSGQLRALGGDRSQRWFSLPDVPTMIELGYTGFVSDTVNALFAPAGNGPPPIVAATGQGEPDRAAYAGSARAGAQCRLRGSWPAPPSSSRRGSPPIPAVKELGGRIGIKPE